MSKREVYYSGPPRPTGRDPKKPLPNEVTPAMRRSFTLVLGSTALVGLGVFIGILIGPEPPTALRTRITELEGELGTARGRIRELNSALQYRRVEHDVKQGALKPGDRQRHVNNGKRYADSMRQVKHNQAAELIEWFVPRWNQLLDNPQDEDRTGRRARVLSRLVGGMGRTIDPADFAAWQAEFFGGNWLGELHMDIDGDGLPGSRTMLNPNDSFVDRPLCDVVMALNQAMRDARIIVQKELRCDSPRDKVSLFIQGKSLDDGLTDFIRTIRREGYWVREKKKQGLRLVVVGPKR